MHARIRYGQHHAVLAALESVVPKEAVLPVLERTGALGVTVMTFSMRVSEVPLEPDFQLAMIKNRLGFRDTLRDLHQHVRIIEVFGQQDLNAGKRQALADDVLDVAIRHGNFGQDGVLFIDHTDEPEGIVLGERI